MKFHRTPAYHLIGIGITKKADSDNDFYTNVTVTTESTSKLAVVISFVDNNIFAFAKTNKEFC